MTAPDGDLSFIGAKAAFFCGGRLLTYQRDDRPGLPWRGMWDLPGGGREGAETPEACLLRELAEEFGLRLGPERLLRRWVLPSMTGGPLPGVFFAGVLTPEEVTAVRFGDEGQRWQMMETAAFLAHPLAIPALVDRVRLALAP
jgi:8-oxo-dGTP diphosphatase